jgi:hypothetical protein
MTKRGFEMSISFMVILIMCIIIFTGSLYFLKQFYSQTTKLREEIDRDTESQLQSLMRDGSVVAIPVNKAHLAVGKGQVFWIGIQNILGAQQDFGMAVAFSSAYSETGEKIDADGRYMNPNWVLYSAGPHMIPNNDFKAVPVSITVGNQIGEDPGDPRNRLKPGTYSFNVCIYKFSDYSPESAVDSCAATGPSGTLETWYTHKVYKLFVEVA